MATDRPSTITEYRMTPITYRCTARTHDRPWIREGATVWHRGDGWAYYASRLSLGHRWEETAGIPLHELLAPLRELSGRDASRRMEAHRTVER